MADELAREIIAQSRPRVRAVNGRISIRSKTRYGGSPGTLAITAKCVNNEPEIQLELSSPVSGGQQAAPLIYRSMSDAVNFAEAFVKARGPEGSNSAMFTSIAEDGSVSPP